MSPGPRGAGRYSPLPYPPRPMRRALLLVLLLPLLAGCASDSGTDRPGAEATLLLDFQPNAVHAGIYLATERDYDEAEGVELDVKAPGASTDALKQLRPAARTSRSSTSTTSGSRASRAPTSSA